MPFSICTLAFKDIHVLQEILFKEIVYVKADLTYESYFSEDFEVCIVLLNGLKQWFPFPPGENSSLTKIPIYENQYFYLSYTTSALHILSSTL